MKASGPPRSAGPLPPVVVLGCEGGAGLYMLGIRLRRNLAVAFGRFGGGRPLPLPAGEYLYLGSARAQRGSASLARRALRHTVRAEGGKAQAIQTALVAALRQAGLAPEGMAPPGRKTLAWHVDFLLERPEAGLTRMVLVRSRTLSEAALGRGLMADPATAVVVPGLGASDVPGNTHLLRLQAGEGWWRELVRSLDQALVVS